MALMRMVVPVLSRKGCIGLGRNLVLCLGPHFILNLPTAVVDRSCQLSTGKRLRVATLCNVRVG